MKKYLIILLIPVIMLCACQENSQEMGTKTYSASEMEKSNQTFLYNDGQKTITEEGVIFPVDSQEGGILTYYDYTQEETYPFCSNVNCDHKDSSCSAWFDSFAQALGIYNRQIYVLSYLNETDKWELVSMDTDGTNRKTIVQFSKEDFGCDTLVGAVSNSWYKDGKAVFAMNCEFWEDEGAEFKAVLKVDLVDGSKEILAEIGNEDQVLSIYDDILLLSKVDPLTPLLDKEEFFEENGKNADYDKYYEEWYNRSYRQIHYLLNLETGEEKDLFDTVGLPPEWDYSCISTDGMFYYSMEKQIGGVNLLTGEVKTVLENENEVTMECCVDGKIFFQTLTDDRNRRLNDCYLNLETEEVTILDKNMPDGGWIYAETSKYFIGNGTVGNEEGYVFIPKGKYYSANYDAAKVMKTF